MQSKPNRICGAFQTGDIKSFFGYVEARNKGNTRIFFDDSRLQIVAYLDFGTVADTATFTAQPTWVREALDSLCAQQAVPRDKLFELVHDIKSEQWKVAFVDPGGEIVSPEIAEQQFDSMTIESVRRIKSSKGPFERHRSVVEDIVITASVPDTMIVTAEMHRGLMLQTIELDLDLVENPEEPALTMRIINPRGIEEEDRNHIKSMLDGAENIGAVHIGTYTPVSSTE